MQAPDVDRIYEPDGLELDTLDEDIAPKLDIEWEPEDKEQLSVIMGSLDRMMRGQYAQATII